MIYTFLFYIAHNHPRREEVLLILIYNNKTRISSLGKDLCKCKWGRVMMRSRLSLKATCLENFWELWLLVHCVPCELGAQECIGQNLALNYFIYRHLYWWGQISGDSDVSQELQPDSSVGKLRRFEDNMEGSVKPCGISWAECGMKEIDKHENQFGGLSTWSQKNRRKPGGSALKLGDLFRWSDQILSRIWKMIKHALNFGAGK